MITHKFTSNFTRLVDTEALARASARHPRRTVLCWLAIVVAAIAAAGMLLGSALTADSDMTNRPESLRAQALIDQRLPAQRQAEEVVVVRSQTATAADPAFRARIARLRRSLSETGAAGAVGDPYGRGGAALVSHDRRAVMLPIVMGADPEDGVERLIAVVQRANRDAGLEASITGTYSAERDFMTVAGRDLRKGELGVGMPAALIVLVLVFGALVTAFVPLATALASIVVAIGLVAVIGQFAQLNVFVLNMISAMGLALGIDYTLFVVSRVREERRAGRDHVDAIALAGATASRAVLFSGSAFVLAMIGMFLVPDAQLRSFAVGAILVGSVTVTAALTLLPAVLRLAGNRLDALRVPLLGRITGGEGRLWPWIAARVLRRPLVSAIIASALLLAAASPVLDLRTGYVGLPSMPDDLVSKQGFVALQESFGESVTDPMQIAIAGDVRSPEVRAAISTLERRLRSDGAFGPASRRSAPEREFTLVSAPFAGDSTGDAAYRAVDRVRRDYVPASFARTDASALVGGTTAHHVDYFANVDRWLPIVIAAVLALTFVLLTLVFRSLVLPLQAVLFNLLSVGAAYGLIVLVFVKGVGNELFGFMQVDTVEAWIPLFLFAVLFGLSMDYNVFLLSRIRERYAQNGDHAGAIAFGIGSTARLITGAALIIVAVFAGFASGQLVMFQQVGFGVAVALLVDATVIRSVLVPASLALVGARTWWLPRRLAWLPKLNPEGEHHAHRPVLRPDDGRDDLDDGRHARDARVAPAAGREAPRDPAGDVICA